MSTASNTETNTPSSPSPKTNKRLAPLLRILLICLAALATVVAIIILCLFLIDFGHFKKQIAAYASDKLGREVRIDGPARLKILPRPTLRVEGLSVQNPSWASQKELLQMQQLDFSASYFELFRGTAIIDRLYVKGLKVNIEYNGDGKNNYQFTDSAKAKDTTKAPKEKTPSNSGQWPLLLEKLELSDSSVHIYRQGKSLLDLELDLIELSFPDENSYQLDLKTTANQHKITAKLDINDISAFSRGDNFDYQLQVNVDDHQLHSEGQAGQLLQQVHSSGSSDVSIASRQLLEEFGQELLHSEQPLKLQLKHRFEKQQLQLQGHALQDDVDLAFNLQLSGENVSGEIKLNSLYKLGALLGIKQLPKQTLAINTNIDILANKQKINQLELSMPTLKAKLDGEVAEKIKLNFNLSGSSLKTLYPDLPEEAVKLSGHFSQEKQLSSLRLDSGEIAQSKINSLSLDYQAEQVPRIKLNADIENIVLEPWQDKSADSSKSAEAGQSDTAPQTATPPPNTTDTHYVLKDEALPWQQLKQVNADATIRINEIIIAQNTLSKIKLDAELEQGNLKLNANLTGPKNSELVTDLKVNQDQVPSVELYTVISDLSYKLVSNSELQSPLTNIHIDLRAEGESPRKLGENSNGNVVLTQGKGQIDNNLLGRFSGDIVAQLVGALNPFAKKEKFTQWECTVFALDINNGKADINSMLGQSDKLIIVGGGNVNLNNEKINIEFNTKPRKGVGVSADMLVTPFVRLAGTLASPSIGLNKKGVLLSGGAAVMTGGISLLAQGMLDRATATGDHCAAALASVDQLEAKPSAATKTQ
ncbi:AsmA family protein [Agaribacterium haliotis]|uniref:AsmA family protein n=1 Tax=Agaribacterium haliotis TaxID=2013869 RepID=UPI000BB57298|nr:AsmA family protein [Agaribacterium haliotis]